MTNAPVATAAYTDVERGYAKSIALVLGVNGALRFLHQQEQSDAPVLTRVPSRQSLVTWLTDERVAASGAVVDALMQRVRSTVLRSSMRILRRMERAALAAADEGDALAASRYAAAHAQAADRLLPRAAPATTPGLAPVPALPTAPGARVSMTYTYEAPPAARAVELEAGA